MGKTTEAIGAAEIIDRAKDREIPPPPGGGKWKFDDLAWRWMPVEEVAINQSEQE